MTKATAPFVLAFALGGCAAGLVETPNPPSTTPANFATICQLRANRLKFIGQVVRTTGALVSDGMTVGYFEDRECGTSSNTVRFSTHHGDATVRSFDEEFHRACSQSRSGYCQYSPRLDLSGLVTENDEGLLHIEVQHIYAYDLVNR